MTGLRPGTLPPPVRMAVLSLDGTGTNLLEIFFRDAQKSDAYLHDGRSDCPAYEKPQGKCGPELQVLGRGLRHTANVVAWLNRESGGKTAALQSSRIVSHRFGAWMVLGG